MKKNKIIISVLVVIALIAIITNTIDKKNVNKVDNDITEDGLPSIIDFNNMKNATIDKKGNKVCISNDLSKKHVLKSFYSKKKYPLYSDNVKIYGNKKTEEIYIEVPITNTSKEELKDININLNLYNDKEIVIFSADNMIIKSIKAGETYILKIVYTTEDVTNTNKYEIWVED